MQTRIDLPRPPADPEPAPFPLLASLAPVLGAGALWLLLQTPMNYLKIDGSLMQSLSTNPELQEKVRGFISIAQKRKIATIAERVEDANTMAVLFQLGAGYMQGYYVHEPEVVLEERG